MMHDYLIKRATELFPRAEVRLNGTIIQAAPVAPEPPKAAPVTPEVYNSLLRRYNALGGDSWMYADIRMPADHEAERIYNQLRVLK